MKKIKNYFKSLGKALTQELREHRSSFLVYSVLRLLVIAVLIRQILLGNYENIFVCVLTLFLFIVPSLVQLVFKIELPVFLEILILIFIYAAEILGELNNYYFEIPNWDTILHTINGFICGAVGFSLVFLLNKSERIQFFISPLFMAIVSFTFSMTIGVMWEFFEFSMDTFFHHDTQKDTLITSMYSVGYDDVNQILDFETIDEVIVNGEVISEGGYIDIGLIDTMEDLIVNCIGAATFSIICFFYVRNPQTLTFVDQLIPRKKEKDKDYLKYQIKKQKE